MDKINLVVKEKPKVTYKEVKRKMKKLTLTQKNRIKEDKKEQKAKEKAEKQRVSQRVKININIPSSVNKSGQPVFNPLNQSSRDLGTGVAQISLLNSINEQLKNKNKPSSINDMFKIPVKQSATQTEPLVNRVIETHTEPTQVFNQGSQTKVKQREQSTQHQGTSVAEPTQVFSQGTGTDTETFYPEEENFNQGMQDINNELQQRLSNARLPEQFSPKVETPIPIIKEPSIPIISKPEETSNENLIEKVSKRGRPKISDEEKQRRAEQKAQDKIVSKQIDEAEKRLIEEEKQKKLAEKRALEEEMKLRKQMNEEDNLITEKLKIEQAKKEIQRLLKEKIDREERRKKYEKAQAIEKQKALNEKVGKDIIQKGTAKEPTGENVSLKVKEIEARRKANEEDNRKAEQKKEKEQIKKVEAEYKRQQKEQQKALEKEVKQKQKEMELRRNA
jgi:hypothetical protein